MNFKNYLLALLVLGLMFTSCRKNTDEGIISIPERDRGEQSIIDMDSITEYLQTHFYNYEEFEANPNTTNFDIIFDTIAGANMEKTPLIDQVDALTVIDNQDEDVTYTLYYLKVREGLGEQPKFADSTYMTYKGTLMNANLFDSAPNPVWFDLIGTVQGFREITQEFRGTDVAPIDNGDGTFTFENYGIGAMFIPSGLGYFSAPPTASIPVYSPLIFRFSIYLAEEADHDNDNVPSYIEDLDGDENPFNDDTDEDNFNNYIDVDDDGDGVLTKNEDLEPDPDPLVDSNGDGDPTNDIGDGDPTNDDTDGDGTPNYLDADDTESNDPDDN